jgi:hypothetical protein
MDADALVRLLAEPIRLKVFAALVLGAGSASEAAAAAGVGMRETAVALRRLGDAGLVDQRGGRVAPRTEVFGELARQTAPSLPTEDLGYADPAVANMLSIFIRDGRLVGLPAQHGRRRLVLEHLAQSFEPGIDYAEREVNAVLRDWTADAGVDHVTLRRYLIDEQLLRREEGVYRRSGGPVDVSK